jgi:hypothetical protein
MPGDMLGRRLWGRKGEGDEREEAAEECGVCGVGGEEGEGECLREIRGAWCKESRISARGNRRRLWCGGNKMVARPEGSGFI